MTCSFGQQTARQCGLIGTRADTCHRMTKDWQGYAEITLKTWSNADSMLGQRRRRRPSIEAALDERWMLAAHWGVDVDGDR